MDKEPLAIFLSPHFDDIALSCAGMAARLSRKGVRCIAITVFTAPSPQGEPLSPYAQWLHSQWGSPGEAGDDQKPINEVRREEERQAMRLLGLEHVWLDLPDAPYRHDSAGEHFYMSDEKLMGRVAPEERRLLVHHIAREIARIAKETGAKGRIRVFAPLGVGRHVDHQLVFLAARRLGPRYGALFYEDYPYAVRPGALASRLEELDTPSQARITSITDLIGVKIAAIARYKSQLEVLFGNSEAMPSAVKAYAETLAGTSGNVGHAERYWRLPSVYVIGRVRE